MVARQPASLRCLLLYPGTPVSCRKIITAAAGFGEDCDALY
jgi:hypothetical protein